MQIEMIQVEDIIPYENNPRRNDEAVEKVAASIREFGFKLPIIIDRENVIVAGHTRLKAAELLGLDEVPVIRADDLTEEQVKAFRLADNKTAELAEWDFDLLSSELDDIFEIDMGEFGFELQDDSSRIDSVDCSTLNERFVVPPFSVLDTRQGYWRERKKAWEGIGIKSELGRKENIMSAGGAYKDIGGTSIFDPVLCEIAYKWFCTDGGKIYDCFAGGSVRGIVASKLGYEYHGIDLRQEQIDANRENAIEVGVNPNWYCDDSLNADKYIQDESCDLVFSCPPYADLEVYSDDPRDISNMEYDDFCKTYKRIIDIACRKLKKNRFAVFVVGDIRDKKGYYRNFVDYTKECFVKNGVQFYNDIVLVNNLGGAVLRAGRIFNSYRKTCKVHQNVLVFYKGDPKKIKENYGEIEIDDSIFDDYAEE